MVDVVRREIASLVSPSFRVGKCYLCAPHQKIVTEDIGSVREKLNPARLSATAALSRASSPPVEASATCRA